MPVNNNFKLPAQNPSFKPSDFLPKASTTLQKVNACVKSISMQVLSSFRDVFHPIIRRSDLTSGNEACQLVNFGFKKRLSASSEELSKERELHQAFDSISLKSNLKDKLHYASKFKEQMPTSDDPEGIDRIIKNRTIMAEIITHRSARKPRALCARVEALSNPDSDQVVHLPNGGATFSIPGGCIGHYVTQEVKMVPDGSGVPKYYFILHNRGGGLTNSLHGPLRFRDKHNVVYQKTSISIEVPKEVLSEAFFKKLVASHSSLSMKACYDCIETHLLAKGGKIQTSPTEKKVLELQEKRKSLQAESKKLKKSKNEIKTSIDGLVKLKQTDQTQGRDLLRNSLKETLSSISNPALKSSAESLLKLIAKKMLSRNICEVFLQELDKEQIRIASELDAIDKEMRVCYDDLIENDASFNSEQVYGTCTESNRTGPEKDMASRKARRQLKLYTIEQMTEGVKKKHLLFRSYREQLLKLSEQRQEELKHKIGH